MKKSKEIEDKVYQEIVENTNKGNEEFEKGFFEKAYDYYMNAMNLIPEPIDIWEASTWVLSALADCSFQMKDYEQAYSFLQIALRCPNGLGNSFIHLRLGQIAYEIGHKRVAKDNLARAYMAGGKEMFESEDPKYFAFIKKYMHGV